MGVEENNELQKSSKLNILLSIFSPQWFPILGVIFLINIHSKEPKIETLALAILSESCLAPSYLPIYAQ